MFRARERVRLTVARRRGRIQRGEQYRVPEFWAHICKDHIDPLLPVVRDGLDEH